MEKRIDLTQGNMLSKLILLALPIMGTSFIQMAYNMTDMIWIGRIGSDAVAAVGTAGFFTWLAMAFVMVSKIGAEIKVAQSIGCMDYDNTKNYIQAALQLNIIFAIGYMLVILLFYKPLIGFFKLGDQEVIQMSEVYLVVMGIGMIFYFLNPVLTAVFNGLGDSRTPFILNTIGLVFNMIFDPLLILGFGPIPSMGVFGAALATVIAQIIVTLGFIIIFKQRQEKYLKIKLLAPIHKESMKTLCKIGFPAAVQSGLFTIISMVLGRIVATFGAVGIAVQKVGSQIEAISWMSAGGLSTALGTFVGQNYGAKAYERIEKGYQMTMTLAISLGIFATILLVFFGEPLFSIFIPEEVAIIQGADYLRILGYSQIFMCIEITVTGAFNGLGRTYLPSIITILLTAARIPMAYYLSQPHLLGIDGVWWSLTISSILKGIILWSIHKVLKMKNKLYRIN